MNSESDTAAPTAAAPVLPPQTPPTTPEMLFRRLDELGIAHPTVQHPAVFTVEEAKALRGQLAGAHVKNLFLRNKKGDAMWLVVALEDRAIDLKALGETIGAGRVSFCSADRLMAHLGVIPGAVTPLALINDRAAVVRVVIDAGLLDRGPVNVHPLVNTMTTALAPADLLAFVAACGHQPEILDLGSL